MKCLYIKTCITQFFAEGVKHTLKLSCIPEVLFLNVMESTHHQNPSQPFPTFQRSNKIRSRW